MTAFSPATEKYAREALPEKSTGLPGRAVAVAETPSAWTPTGGNWVPPAGLPRYGTPMSMEIAPASANTAPWPGRAGWWEPRTRASDTPPRP
ncbi:hypothetical protein ACIO3O_07995 [Streptomyces sp. NPDC087440]|uniref:hypothetical protein n=1 Tax=Streptomyces sp. NPDC087440 TaxID=3365790 RepID=UPI003801D9AC